MKTIYPAVKFLLFILILSLFSCTKGGGDNGTNNTSATYYYKATIGSVNYYQDVTQTNNYIAGSGLGGVDDVDLTAGIEPMSTTPGSTEFHVTKGILHNYLSLTNAQLRPSLNQVVILTRRGLIMIRTKTVMGFIFIGWTNKEKYGAQQMDQEIRLEVVLKSLASTMMVMGFITT